MIVEKELLVAVSNLLGEFTSSLEGYLAKISKQEEGLYESFYRLKELLREDDALEQKPKNQEDL